MILFITAKKGIALFFMSLILVSLLGYSSKNAISNASASVLVRVVNPISREKILPDSPISGIQTNLLSMAATRGEYKPVSFVLQSVGATINDLQLEVTKLVSLKATIDSSRVDIRVVKPWYQSFYAWDNIGKTNPGDFRQTLVPELLLKDDSIIKVDNLQKKNYVKIINYNNSTYVWVNQPLLAKSETLSVSTTDFPVRDAEILAPVNLERGKNKQFWVTVHVPEDAEAGEYVGKITFKANGTLIGGMDIKLTVLPFDLVESPITYSIYYRGILRPDQSSISSELKDRVQLKAELINMLSHGVTNPVIYQDTSEEALFREVLTTRKDVGIDNSELYLCGLLTNTFPRTLAGMKELKARTRMVIDVSKPYGATKVFVYGKDEANGNELRNELNAWRAVHEAGGYMFGAGQDGTFEIGGELLNLFVHAFNPLQSEGNKWHGLNHKIFSYANPQTGPENPLTFRRNYGVVLWATGYDGAMPYAYQHCFGACWNDMDSPEYRDHMFTYPTANGVIDTIAWEGFREATTDVRYFATLERYINSVSPNDTYKQQQANNAKAFLETLRQSIPKGSSGMQRTRYFDLDLDKVRAQVIKYIIDLM